MTEVSDYRAILGTWGFATPEGGTPEGNSTFITYSFATSAEQLQIDPNWMATDFFSELADVYKAQFRQALDYWASVCGVVFLETRSDGDVVIGVRDLIGGYEGYASGSNSAFYRDGSGALTVYGVEADPSLIAIDFPYVQTMLHEIGHVLGLDHPHDGAFTLPGSLDHVRNTIMSYHGYTERLGPMDIDAVRAIYGSPENDGSQFQSWGWDGGSETLTAVARPDTELVLGSGANDVIDASFNRLVVTRGGDDSIYCTRNDVEINCGAGFDTVRFDDNRSEFSAIYAIADGTLLYKDDLVSTVYLAERIEFDDGTLIFDLDSENASFAYRIYAAAYGRTPDEGGLRFWTDVLDGRGEGPPDVDDKEFVASFFLTANEFVDLYGANPTNEQYINALYENVLKREADAAGYEFWLGVIASGQGKDDLLIWFTDSDENVANVAPDVDNGFWVV